MRLRCFLLGLLVLGLLVGPALAEHIHDVVLDVNDDGKFDKTRDLDIEVAVGERIAWMCLENGATPKFELKVYQIKPRTPNRPGPWPGASSFQQTQPCGTRIISKRMQILARWNVYKVTFEVYKIDEMDKDKPTHTWDPHWRVK